MRAGANAGLPLYLQRAWRPSHTTTGSEAAVALSPGPGQPLDQATRARMEARFGHDFGGVRVHTGAGAARAAEAVQARAYTVGQDIVFGDGQYAPGAAHGAELLGHELAHVVQQAAGPVAGTPRGDGPAVSDPADRFEQAADRAAEAVHGDGAAVPAHRTVPGGVHAASGPSGQPTVQRQPSSGVPDLTLRPPPMLARSMGSLTVDRFAFDSAAVPSLHQAALTALAQTIVDLLRSYPGGSVVVTGHTDATGGESHNLGLGQRRADAVRDTLIAAGVPSETISTSSAGESSPRVVTEQAEPRNRRVEVHFEPELRVHLVPPLTLPSLTPAPPERVPPPLLPTVPPIWQPETPEETARRILAPIPPRPAPSASVSDLVYQRLDDGLNATMQRLGVPAWARGLIRDGAHAALSKGAESLLDAALDQTSLGSEEREAIRTTFRAAVRVPIQ